MIACVDQVIGEDVVKLHPQLRGEFLQNSDGADRQYCEKSSGDHLSCPVLCGQSSRQKRLQVGCCGFWPQAQSLPHVRTLTLVEIFAERLKDVDALRDILLCLSVRACKDSRRELTLRHRND